MNILVFNGSPRKNRNTAQLLNKVLEGAQSAGAEGELIHLYSLDFKGCSSCMQCKLVGGKHYGRCAIRDELTLCLDKTHTADVIVLGSPVYFGGESACARAFLERLCYQYYIYSKIKPTTSPRKKATALVYTMNVSEARLPEFQLDRHIGGTKALMEKFFAPCEILLSTDTKQVKDYSKYEMDLYNTDAKDLRFVEVFPQDLRRAFELGVKLLS